MNVWLAIFFMVVTFVAGFFVGGIYTAGKIKVEFETEAEKLIVELAPLLAELEKNKT